jgi:hypothetical protein
MPITFHHRLDEWGCMHLQDHMMLQEVATGQ